MPMRESWEVPERMRRAGSGGTPGWPRAERGTGTMPRAARRWRTWMGTRMRRTLGRGGRAEEGEGDGTGAGEGG